MNESKSSAVLLGALIAAHYYDLNPNNTDCKFIWFPADHPFLAEARTPCDINSALYAFEKDGIVRLGVADLPEPHYDQNSRISILECIQHNMLNVECWDLADEIRLWKRNKDLFDSLPPSIHDRLNLMLALLEI
jgi:hypothetical protein